MKASVVMMTFNLLVIEQVMKKVHTIREIVLGSQKYKL